MVLDPIPQPLPVHFFGSRPQPPTSHRTWSKPRISMCVWTAYFQAREIYACVTHLLMELSLWSLPKLSHFDAVWKQNSMSYWSEFVRSVTSVIDSDDLWKQVEQVAELSSWVLRNLSYRNDLWMCVSLTYGTEFVRSVEPFIFRWLMEVWLYDLRNLSSWDHMCDMTYS